MTICGWVEVSSSGDSKFGIGKGVSGREYREVGVSGSGSSKIDIGMRAAQQAVGSRHRAVVSS